MTAMALHVVKADDAIRQRRAARGAAIDKLGVDRSRWANCPMPPMPPEAEAAEERLSAIRAETTMVDRMAAYRVFASVEA